MRSHRGRPHAIRRHLTSLELLVRGFDDLLAGDDISDGRRRVLELDVAAIDFIFDLLAEDPQYVVELEAAQKRADEIRSNARVNRERRAANATTDDATGAVLL